MLIYAIGVCASPAAETTYDQKPGKAVIQKPRFTKPVKPQDVETSNPNVNGTPAPPVVITPPQVMTGSGANYGNLTLRLQPLTLRIRMGESAKQEIILDNPKGGSVDEAEIAIKYDPQYLNVMDVDADAPGVNLEPGINTRRNPTIQYLMNVVDTEKGIIYLKLKSMTSNNYLGGTVATIHWKPLKPVFYTPLKFIFAGTPNGTGTQVTRLGKDMLGWDYDPKDGVITGGIAILSIAKPSAPEKR